MAYDFTKLNDLGAGSQPSDTITKIAWRPFEDVFDACNAAQAYAYRYVISGDNIARGTDSPSASNGQARASCYSDDGLLYAVAANDTTVAQRFRLYEIDGSTLIPFTPSPTGGGGTPADIAITPDNQYVIVITGSVLRIYWYAIDLVNRTLT